LEPIFVHDVPITIHVTICIMVGGEFGFLGFVIVRIVVVGGEVVVGCMAMAVVH
jgi:hypothetical protein